MKSLFPPNKRKKRLMVNTLFLAGGGMGVGPEARVRLLRLDGYALPRCGLSPWCRASQPWCVPVLVVTMKFIGCRKGGKDRGKIVCR